MQRRQLIRAAAAAAALPALAACGGGGGSDGNGDASITQFTSDKTSYMVGDTAQLTATFSGTGKVDPGNLPITSGTPLAVVVAGPTSYTLTVSAPGSAAATRTLALTAAYRDSFVKGLVMNGPRGAHQAVGLADGRVLLVGGQSDASTLPATVLQYSASTEAFTAGGALLSGRVGHTATAVSSTRVLVFGGTQDLPLAAIAEVYDASSSTSRAVSIQPRDARAAHTATLLRDGRVLLVGGANNGIKLATADLYDPSSDSFTRVASTLSVGRSGHSAAMLPDGSVLIYGGLTQGGAAPPAERYDPTQQGFTSLGLPDADPVQSALSTIATLANGDLLVIGGVDDSGVGRTRVMRIALSGGVIAFSLYGQLATARVAAAATTLTDGRVLVSGGAVDSAQLGSTSTELLSSDGHVSAGPAMTSGRTFHSSTLTSSGKVLVAGGVDASGATIVTSADLFA